jgi:nitroimidazol reductase NimA-like FMN-containing flavoprotein (pyridoxamine 5'-phosphate oxidase superfamily)
MIKNLDENSALEFLAGRKFGHLGCVLETGDPLVVPVNYLYQNQWIYIHSLPGQKLDALRANPKVCLQVEQIETACRWQSVIASGEFEEVEEASEKIQILREFIARFERLTPVEAMSVENWNERGLVVFRIRIKHLSGLSES